MNSRMIMLCGLLLLTSTMLSAQTKNATVFGEVVDIASYMTSGTRASSPEGKEMIEASARGGNPLGILEENTGKIYLVTMKQAGLGANTSLLPWVGMKVAAKGDVYKKGSCQVLVLNVIGKSIK
ncbi:MAG: hypothetical protein ACKVRP_15535 [Bacteroidota bacterium]